MSFFESMLALLLAAILLLQVSRRLSLPYPAMLAAAGVCVALIPGTPTIRIDPEMALALFIAPALLDAAYDFPVGLARRLWRPLFALAVVAVLLSTAVVAWIGWAFAGLPIAAAVALGAIVAPPDAAAATAVLDTVSMPRRTTAVLKGESLLNDASALLLFTAATQVQAHGGIDMTIGLQLGLAAPGGILLGMAMAWLSRRISPFVAGTLGGNLLEFVTTFWVWIIADRLHLSAVLCVVAFAMTLASSTMHRQNPRIRVHSYAVWGTVTFLLNVLAFLLMGMQARTIVGGMDTGRLWDAARVAGMVVVGAVGVRVAWVLIYNRLAYRFAGLRGDFKPATLAQGFLVGWAGMRGLVTLAAAFALPADFPQRDLIVLTAFAVVLVTLVIQGLTLAPLIRLLGLTRNDAFDEGMAVTRHQLAETALATLDGKTEQEADHFRYLYGMLRTASGDPPDEAQLDRHRALGLAAIRAERAKLAELRESQEVGADVFEAVQEELDWKELAMLADDDRRMEAS